MMQTSVQLYQPLGMDLFVQPVLKPALWYPLFHFVES